MGNVFIPHPGGKTAAAGHFHWKRFISRIQTAKENEGRRTTEIHESRHEMIGNLHPHRDDSVMFTPTPK